MTTKRINITLPEDLHDQAGDYCRDKGIPFSNLVADLLRGVLSPKVEAPPPQPQPVQGPPRPPIRELVKDATELYLTSPKGEAHLRELIAMVMPLPAPTPPGPQVEAPTITPDTLTPPPPVEVTLTPPTPPAETPPHVRGEARVPVTPELLARLQKFHDMQVSEASGVSRGPISKVRRGAQTLLQTETYQKLNAGLEKLESGAAPRVSEADQGTSEKMI